MAALVLATWNLLHRVHAENYDEGLIADHPDEAARVSSIAARAAEQMAGGVAALCFQEVSGDQLEALRRALPKEAQLFTLRYPRLPRPRHAHRATLQDPSEHLVTAVAPSWAAELRVSSVFPDDPGKGLLGVSLAGRLAVFNTHVSYGERSPGQLHRLAAAAADGPPAVALLGDFNAGLGPVERGLGGGFTGVALSPGGPPTRPRR